MKQACPSCPDGNEWSSTGPTGRACTTCKGKAYIGEDAPTNASGPAGTYGCACVHHSARMCYEIRYDLSPLDEPEERCECLCHQWDEEDDDG